MKMRWIVTLWLVPCFMCFSSAQAIESLPLYPAMFIFGDSLVDVGNNNYLETALAKANTMPNGIDFPTHNATGRFCNGKTVLDIMAEYVGLGYTPPYLAPTTHGAELLEGVNYASGAGGILDDSGANYYARLSFNVQLTYFKSTVMELSSLLGDAQTATFLAESLYVVSLGTNDYLYNYLLPNSYFKADYTPAQFHTFLASQLKTQLITLYDLGARKVLVVTVGPFGCIPSRLVLGSSNGTCVDSDNEMAVGFNTAVEEMLPELTSTLPGAMFVFGNTYSMFWDIVHAPARQGFTITNQGCCGFGRYKGQLPCSGIFDSLCANRSSYIFWDPYHPTEAVNRILCQKLFSGSTSNIAPMNIYELSQWIPS